MVSNGLSFEVRGIPAHIAAGIEVDPATDCWLWTKAKSRDGYGLTSLNNRTHQAHRLVYILLVGEPDQGLVLDHLCRTRRCVNPQHMEPVTPGENIRRSQITPAGMTHCLRCGSELSPWRNQRRCLPCHAAYEKSRLESKRIAERERRAGRRSA